MGKRFSTEEAQKLWQDYRSGDLYALAKLMQGYYTDLYHWGMRLHPEKEFVKDCIQEVFLALYRIHSTINPVDNIRSYLMVTLKSRMLRELSKKHVTHTTDLTDDYRFSVDFSADLRFVEEENEVYQIRKLEQTINHLPPRQKEVIYLRFYQEMSFEQIAEVMQMGRQSVYNLLQKSLHSLRKHWTTGVISLFFLFR